MKFIKLHTVDMEKRRSEQERTQPSMKTPKNKKKKVQPKNGKRGAIGWEQSETCVKHKRTKS